MLKCHVLAWNVANSDTKFLLELTLALVYTFVAVPRTLSVRKMKSANTKLCFLTLVNRISSPDWRAKLLAQYVIDSASQQGAMLRQLAGSCRVVSAGGGA